LALPLQRKSVRLTSTKEVTEFGSKMELWTESKLFFETFWNHTDDSLGNNPAQGGKYEFKDDHTENECDGRGFNFVYSWGPRHSN
jgi:hypothetical protein